MNIDLTYLKNMSAGNKDLMLEMIGLFKSQVVEFTKGMDELYEKKEYESLGRLAHKAKSSISIMGLEKLSIELKNFENLTKAGEQIDQYPKFIANFKNQTSEAIAELDEVTKNIDIYL